MSESSLSGRAPRPRRPTRRRSPIKRAGKNRDKRERILRAAVKVFAKKGFYDARVSAVAKAAGVADGTIYLYFESKDALLLSLFEDRVETLLSHMQAELTKLPNAPAKLRRILEIQLGVLGGERDLAEVFTVIFRQSTKLLKQYAATKFTAYLNAIAAVVSEGQAAGDFRPDVAPLLVARATWGALDGIALTWALGRAERGALARSAGQLADVFLRGLAP